ncbi:MAG: hypothetical protein IK016_07250 [Lachnospiraceae bacterium]|nr:hypothetical protein [Lachnospiraceae bacterium]
MSATEIILIIIGCIAVVIGYVMPASIVKGEIDPEETKRKMDHIMRKSLDGSKQEIRDRIEDTLEEAMVKSERGMERITNDSMVAISDYADSVLGDIHKNHDEVVFMYDMLSDKHKNLTQLVTDVTKSADDARKTVLDAELTARESMRTAQEAMDQIREARQELEVVLQRARATAENAEAVAHAEAGLSGMIRLEQEDFAPLAQEYARVLENDRVLQRVPQEERSSQTQAAELVAGLLSSKVVPIDEAKERHEQQVSSLMESSTQVVTDGALAVATEAVPMNGDKQSRILEMHNLGKSNVAIARELNMGVGEVRLVIDLFSRQRKGKK